MDSPRGRSLFSRASGNHFCCQVGARFNWLESGRASSRGREDWNYNFKLTEWTRLGGAIKCLCLFVFVCCCLWALWKCVAVASIVFASSVDRSLFRSLGSGLSAREPAWSQQWARARAVGTAKGRLFITDCGGDGIKNKATINGHHYHFRIQVGQYQKAVADGRAAPGAG